MKNYFLQCYPNINFLNEDMSVSRDDFSIAFRSALLQRGATQKFSILSLIIVAIIIFFLDVYGFTVIKKQEVL